MTYFINKFQRTLIWLILFSSILSCKKLLNIPANPPDKISARDAFSDSLNVESVMAGIYINFYVVDKFGFISVHNGGLSAYTGLSADELVNMDVFTQYLESPFYNNALLSTNAALFSFWGDAYAPIYSVNAAIIGINTSEGLTASQKDHFTGELKTVRALYYFNIVNLFGAVPLITGTDYAANAPKPRSPVDEIYPQIVLDLEDARALLTDDYPSEGRARPNRHTATALLAKVYLYLENWEKAAELSREIIASGLYALEPDLNNVFLRGSTEAIWQISTEGGQYTQTNEGVIFVPSEFEFVPKYQIAPSLSDAFEPDDQRYVNWVGTLFDFDGVPHLYPFKYKNNSVFTATTTEDYMIFRLAEQYLIRAEALAHLGQLEESIADLNEIRSRAGLPDRELTDEETLLADIMHERRIELFCEWGNRWFDLKRTQQADIVLGASKPEWQAHDALYPIPLDQLQTNPFLEQNPGY